MTDQNGENPSEPLGDGPPPPDSSATPPPAAPAPSGGTQSGLGDATSALQGAHKFDLGIIAAGVVAFLAGFMPFYTASVSAAGISASTSWSAYHGFFGWFAVWVALAGAGVVAAVALRHQSADRGPPGSGRVVRPLAGVPDPRPLHLPGRRLQQRQRPRWPHVRHRPRLRLLARGDRGAGRPRAVGDADAGVDDHDQSRLTRSALRRASADSVGARRAANLLQLSGLSGRPRWPTHVVRRENAKPSCHGWSVAALVQRRWRPLCVPMK